MLFMRTVELPTPFLARRASELLRSRLRSARAVVVNGPRQSGKTSLLAQLNAESGGSYLSLDDATNLRLARTDPAGFVTGFEEPLLIDEVQRGGDPLVLAVKSQLDRSPRKGRFVLAGSTRFLSEPRLSESLAGRVRFIDLWPLSQGEIDGRPDSFVDCAFEHPDSIARFKFPVITRHDVFKRVVRGGLPEAVLAPNDRDRSEFLKSYVRALTAKDVRDLADLEHVGQLGRIIRLLAARTSTELNVTDLARELGIAQSTFRRYVPLFETTYVHHTLPAWSGNSSSKVVKRPKLHFVDSGAAAILLGANADALARPTTTISGQLLETFVAGELARQLTWAETDASLYHWRHNDGREVDIVIEAADGRVVAIEVKAGVDLDPAALSGLNHLRDQLGSRFVAGFVIHCAERVRPAGERLWSVPVNSLWEWGEVRSAGDATTI
jgi:uncharacterized protein